MKTFKEFVSESKQTKDFTRLIKINPDTYNTSGLIVKDKSKKIGNAYLYHPKRGLIEIYDSFGKKIDVITYNTEEDALKQLNKKYGDFGNRSDEDLY